MDASLQTATLLALLRFLSYVLLAGAGTGLMLYLLLFVPRRN